MKRPEHPDGRDPQNESLVSDARKKAIARGLPYYFTCNMADVVLFAVATKPGEEDRVEGVYHLAPITHSNQVSAYYTAIDQAWTEFLNDLENRLRAIETARPSVTTAAVVALRERIDDLADEAITRTQARVAADKEFANDLREEAYAAFGFSVALNPKYPANLQSELLQILRLGAFVIAQKLVLYRVLAEVGPKRVDPFTLDPVPSVAAMTDPSTIREVFRQAAAHASRRSKDYETAFAPQPLEEALFVGPETPEEVESCRAGELWQRLMDEIASVSWSSITQNLVGFLYEAIVDPEFRHQLGQHYTREDVVDVLTAFAIRTSADSVLDPACGAGSFLRSAYQRKRDLGETHDEALGEVWGFDIASFAAELATISLATADAYEPAAYPRVLLTDFFEAFPKLTTQLQIPGTAGALHIPPAFDCVVGNPPYISYRRQTNQKAVLRALSKMPRDIPMPAFSGKSDEYVWFVVHATRFLKQHARLAFVVSSGLLFADYGIPLIRFMARHYRIRAVIDSAVERWFIEADTNTVLILLEREELSQARAENRIRFVRLRQPLARLLPSPGDGGRRDAIEDLLDNILSSESDDKDPRFLVNTFAQGEVGGVVFSAEDDTDGKEQEQPDEDED